MNFGISPAPDIAWLLAVTMVAVGTNFLTRRLLRRGAHLDQLMAVIGILWCGAACVMLWRGPDLRGGVVAFVGGLLAIVLGAWFHRSSAGPQAGKDDRDRGGRDAQPPEHGRSG